MYLEIFVIAAFACVGVVRGKEEASFMCPTCHAAGVASDCDAKIENKRCYEEDPVCLVTSSYYGQQISTKRDCAPRKFYPFHKSVCKITGRCATAMCDTSGCMAELSSEALFMCPFCQVVGDASNCGAQLENKFCNTEDAVCVMRSENIGLDQYTERFCAKKEDYQRLKMYCESYRDCTITMCDTSGCMVE